MTIAGTSPDGSLVEIVELPGHRWFVAVQYHPEFKSKPTDAHPLFAGFIGAAIEHHAAKHSGGAEAQEVDAPARRTKKRNCQFTCASGVPTMSDEKKIIIDEDWKSQVAAEKEAALHKPAAASGERRPTDGKRLRRIARGLV